MSAAPERYLSSRALSRTNAKKYNDKLKKIAELCPASVPRFGRSLLIGLHLGIFLAECLIAPLVSRCL